VSETENIDKYAGGPGRSRATPWAGVQETPGSFCILVISDGQKQLQAYTKRICKSFMFVS